MMQSLNIYKSLASDIVRDYSLASVQGSQLRDRQRNFLEAIISSICGASPKLVEYAKTKLVWHMKGALDEPRAKDELARRLALHEDVEVPDTISGQVCLL